MQKMRDLPVKLSLTGISALAFTSKNGVEAFARLTNTRLPAYCVGEATHACARALGFEAKAAAGTAENLAQILPQTGVLHLHGQHVRQVLSQNHLAIYSQDALPLSDEAQALLSENALDAAALFSPRSAALFAEYLTEIPLPRLVIYALSEAVAAALPNRLNTRICPVPSAKAMLGLLSADFPA
jgi:uroporphyrinogen-III synthase